MVLSLSHSRILFITSGSLFLILGHLSLISGDSCPTPPTITEAQYNQIKDGTTVSQMQTILGGFGYLQSTEYFDASLSSKNTLTYTYQGTNEVPTSVGLSGATSGYALFTFSALTQKLTFKIEYGLCSSTLIVGGD